MNDKFQPPFELPPAPCDAVRDVAFSRDGREYYSRLLFERCPPQLIDPMCRAFIDGNVTGLMALMDNTTELHFVDFNARALMDRGIYETALMHALVDIRTNNHHWTPQYLEAMVDQGDRAVLQQCGDPLPDGQMFTVYRGVAGVGRQRRVHGISWSLSIPIACWFAARYDHLPKPAVWSSSVSRDDVWFYSNDRDEQEIVARPVKPRQMKLTAQEIHRIAAEEQVERQAQHQRRLAEAKARFAAT